MSAAIGTHGTNSTRNSLPPRRREAMRRQVAWVTGASRGMGANTAMRLAAAGYDVALTARDQERLDAVAETIEASGASALPLAADLTDRSSIESFADSAMALFG